MKKGVILTNAFMLWLCYIIVLFHCYTLWRYPKYNQKYSKNKIQKNYTKKCSYVTKFNVILYLNGFLIR